MSRAIQYLSQLRDGQRAVADIRGCVNASPNTVAAAAYAVELGFTSIFLSALYHDKDEDEKPVIFLVSPFISDHLSLSKMTYESWFTGVHAVSQLAIPDGLSDLAVVQGLEEIWIDFINPPEMIIDGWGLAAQSLPPHISVRLFSSAKPSYYPEDAVGADPDGKMGYRILARPSNILTDAALDKKPGRILSKTFSADGHPCAEICLVPLP